MQYSTLMLLLVSPIIAAPLSDTLEETSINRIVSLVRSPWGSTSVQKRSSDLEPFAAGDIDLRVKTREAPSTHHVNVPIYQPHFNQRRGLSRRHLETPYLSPAPDFKPGEVISASNDISPEASRAHVDTSVYSIERFEKRSDDAIPKTVKPPEVYLSSKVQYHKRAATAEAHDANDKGLYGKLQYNKRADHSSPEIYSAGGSKSEVEPPSVEKRALPAALHAVDTTSPYGALSWKKTVKRAQLNGSDNRRAVYAVVDQHAKSHDDVEKPADSAKDHYENPHVYRKSDYMPGSKDTSAV